MKIIRLNGQIINVGEWDYVVTEAGEITNPLPIGAVVTEEEYTAPRSQKTDIVLSRLTDAEYDALTTSTVIGIRRAVDMARSTGVISDSHPAFAPFAAGSNALGIIAASRWPVLLAP